MRQPLLAIALAGALAACSNDSSSGPSTPPPPGCDKIAMTGTCYSDPAATPTTCSSDFGTWLAYGCPGTDLVGICFGATGRTTYYYWPNYATHEAAAACSGSFVERGARVTAWCDLRTTSYRVCFDLAGTESDMATSGIDWACPLVGGTWHTSGACPTAGRTGTCSSVGTGGVEYWGRYYDPATASSDAAACTGGGDTWTPN